MKPSKSFQAIREGRDVAELEKKHEKEQEVLEAMFDAEVAEQNAEIGKKLNEEYKDGVRQMHRDLLQQVRRQYHFRSLIFKWKIIGRVSKQIPTFAGLIQSLGLVFSLISLTCARQLFVFRRRSMPFFVLCLWEKWCVLFV